jgi:hypothetical protein
VSRWLALVLALWLPLGIVEAASLQPFRATYSLRYNGMKAGTGELQLERQPDGRWSYRLRMQGSGLFRLVPQASLVSRSVFRIEGDRVVPEAFTSTDANQDITFDWSGGRVTGKVSGKRIDLPAQDGLLDPQSAQVALMQELLVGRMPSRFVLVDEDRIKTYLYAVEGSESLDSAAGRHHTDIFSSRRPNSKKATFFWCAPELGFIPLKVERRNGRDVEWSMTLDKLER